MIGPVDIVIVTEHGQSQTLAEATGTDEEKILIRPFHFLDKPCLIDIVIIVLAYSHEVHHSVGDAFYLLLHLAIFHILDTFDLRWLMYDFLSVHPNFPRYLPKNTNNKEQNHTILLQHRLNYSPILPHQN